MCMDIRENLVFGINFNSDIKVHKILEAHLPLAMFSVTDKYIYIYIYISIYLYLYLYFYCGIQGICWKRKWQPTPVFLPGESQGQRSLVGCHLSSNTESDMTEATQQQQGICDHLTSRETQRQIEQTLQEERKDSEGILVNP